jgi:hypothetical protein
LLSGFALCRSGADAEIFVQCLDVASIPFSDGRVAALSLFANVVVGLKSKVQELISLNSMQRLVAILDAAHTASDFLVVEASLAVIWNIAASNGDTETLVTQVRSLNFTQSQITLSTIQICPGVIKSIVQAADSSPKALQYCLGVRMCFGFLH